MLWSLPDEFDSKKEEELRKLLAARHSDVRRTTKKDVEYPHVCIECGYPAFMSATRPHCTNLKCKWVDKKKLAQDLLKENPAIEPNPYPF